MGQALDVRTGTQGEAPASRVVAHESEPAPAAATVTRASILVVDDHPANLVALEAVLDPLGHEVIKCSSGEEALRHLLSRDFALILLDVQMPGLDGFKTAQLIK